MIASPGPPVGGEPVGGEPAGVNGRLPAVRRAGPDDVATIASLLSRAFVEDPVASYIFSDDASRERRLRRFFELQLRHNYLVRGEVYVLDARLSAAMWMPPSPQDARGRDVIAHFGLVPLLGARFLATRRLSLMLASHHPKLRHYYLGTIGTDPAHQGRGAGSLLLAPVLHRCDALGLPAYLECSREENVAFYARHGFVVSERVEAPDGGPSLWLMWRAPRPAG
ncbi:MAG TPA: GNAT family N-acetyltransferase [Acidimicrobiales bacterium]|nr:GNAT family N-acetyltransferase [Acidimicrobiales bacterium]